MKKGNDQEEQNKEVSRLLDRKVTVVIFYFFLNLAQNKAGTLLSAMKPKVPKEIDTQQVKSPQ